MQACTLLQTDNHASNPPLIFCPSCHPTNSIKALNAKKNEKWLQQRLEIKTETESSETVE